MPLTELVISRNFSPATFNKTIRLFLSFFIFLGQKLEQAFLIWDGPSIFGGISLCDLFMFLLATPVQFIVGRRFYRAAWMGVKHGSLGMDALVVMGTSSAYIFSVCVLLVKCSFNPLFPSKCTFETAAMLLTLVSLGKLMEAIAKGQTSSSLTALVKLQPRTALLLPAHSPSVSVSGNINGDGGSGSSKGLDRAKGKKTEVEVKEIDAGLVEVRGGIRGASWWEEGRGFLLVAHDGLMRSCFACVVSWTNVYVRMCLPGLMYAFCWCMCTRFWSLCGRRNLCIHSRSIRVVHLSGCYIPLTNFDDRAFRHGALFAEDRSHVLWGRRTVRRRRHPGPSVRESNKTC